jgi:TonB family protein
MQRFIHPSTSRILRIAAFVLVACLALAPQAYAQTAQTESDLRTRIARQPNDAGPYIELAKLYADQQRYDEAIRMLQSAIITLQRAQAMTLPPLRNTITAGPPVSTTIGQAPVRVGGDIKEPKKIKHVAPIYPADAMAAAVQGVVIMEIVIDPNGDVADAKVLRSVPMLDQAAIDAVRQWRFTPTLLNNIPVSVVMTVTVNFTLNR